MHEYHVKGHPKVKIITYLALISFITVTPLSGLLDYFLNKIFHWGITLTISASLVFSVLYIVFSKWLWKKEMFGRIFKFPNLNGEYKIEGLSLKNPSGEKKAWSGLLTIEQDWEKILIVLNTNTSSSTSRSINGCIEYIPKNKYVLNYNYRNKPDIEQKELAAHDGNCEISFDKDILKGRANYYNNGKERESYGMMELRRISNE